MKQVKDLKSNLDSILELRNEYKKEKKKIENLFELTDETAELIRNEYNSFKNNYTDINKAIKV